MPSDHREELRRIRTFPQFVKYLQDQLDWPVETDSFDDLTFDYEPEDLGLDPKTSAKIRRIRQLRPLVTDQPWGIFFVEFEPKRLPIVALRRILSQLVFKKRASANRAEQPSWNLHDLLFISAYGDGEAREISLAHFSEDSQVGDLATLRVLGWDGEDTGLHLDHVHRELTTKLCWPDDPGDADQWRKTWSSAFTLRPREVIATSKDLAVRLADLASGIRRKVNAALAVETENGRLRKLMKAFQESLIHDLEEDDFADMYAQTIAYGLLSARVSRPAGLVAEDVVLMVPSTNPFLKELMETFLHIGGRRRLTNGEILDFDELGINEVVDTLRDANMEAVLRDFDNRNPQEDPVIHFYELFLKEYDPKRRMQRGVFYTPKPVVSYIVRSVHELLQTEFGLEDGLASTVTWREMADRFPALPPREPGKGDPAVERSGIQIPEGTDPNSPFVTILDPATGTATFLVEVIDVIHCTLTDKWKRQRLSVAQQKDAWNEYVPKHLLPRLYGYELMMAPYAIAHMKIGLKLAETGYRFGTEERARIYLTNALEPWVTQLPLIGFDALAHEAAGVNEVKRDRRFTVVIGNPPYAGISSNMSVAMQRIVDAYRIVDGAALSERKLWLQDDYVKFIRTAQTTVEKAGVAVFGYITNHSYLDNPTFRGMRQSLLGTFQCIRVLDLHGNTTKKEQSPDGSDDKNVFDIKQGVAVCIAARGGPELGVMHADLWGGRGDKYSWLAGHSTQDTAFQTLAPDSPFYFFDPQNLDFRAEYEQGWKITEIMPSNTTGFVTARDHFVIGFSESELLERMSDFANRSRSDAEIRSRYFVGKGSNKYEDGDSRGWRLPEARKRVQRDTDWESRVVDCLYRPFDARKIYWCEWMVDWPRPEVTRHLLAGDNFGLNIGRAGQVIDQGPWNIVFCTRSVTEFNLFRRGGNSLFPLWLYEDRNASQKSLGIEAHRRLNIQPAFLKGLALRLRLDVAEPYGVPRGLTPEEIVHYAYAVFHCPGYRRRYAEFLKVDFPRLPLTGDLSLFRALARLGGELVALHLLESSKLAQPITEFISSRNPEVEKISWSRDTVWVDKAQRTGFRGVREAVWNFHIGGYQVCQKWLKDRKGRTLSQDDIEHYQKIVVALSETIRLMQEIDTTIDRHGGWPGAFVTANAATTDDRNA